MEAVTEEKKYSRARNWVLTWNNPEFEFSVIRDRIVESKELKCYSFQLEKGEETGTLHLQCYLGFHKQVYQSAVLKLLGTKRTSPEVCRDAKASWKYCMKAATRVEGPCWVPFEEGHQGERTDLQKVSELLAKPGGIRDVITLMPDTYIKYHSGIDKLEVRLRGGPDGPRNKNVIFLFGRTGTGKTTWAMETMNAKRVEFDGKFFQYRGSDVALFDEADGLEIPETLWLKLLDRQPYDMNIKGGSTIWNPHTIIIASNFSPESWFLSGPHREALRRRITKIICTDGPWEGSWIGSGGEGNIKPLPQLPNQEEFDGSLPM